MRLEQRKIKTKALSKIFKSPNLEIVWCLANNQLVDAGFTLIKDNNRIDLETQVHT